MTNLRYFALLIGVYFVIGCNKNISIEQTIEEAKDLSKSAILTAKLNSSGANVILNEPDVSKLSLRSNGSDQMMIFKSRPPLSKKSANIIHSLVGRFERGEERSKEKSQCRGYNDPDLLHEASSYSDYYSQRTANILTIASKLETMDEIFYFVKNQIINSNYFGATQSADSLIKVKEGSVVDKNNLLVTLLRAQEIPAYLYYGEIYLTIDVAKRYLDAGYVGDIFTILSQVFGSYFVNGGTVGSDYFKVINGTKYIVIPHVWTRAFDGTQWKNFDPTQLSDPLMSKRNKGLLPSSEKMNYKAWFFEADSNGDFVKAKTVFDFLIESIKLESSIDYINTKEQYSEANYSDGVLSNLSPCIQSSFLGFENSDHEYRGEVTLTVLGIDEIKINQPIAKLSEHKSYVSHTAGLYSDVSVGSGKLGYIQFKIDEEVIAEVSQNTGVEYDIKAKVIYPKSFGTRTDEKTFAGKYKAGEVFVTNFFARPTYQLDLIQGIEALKNDIESSKSSKILMSDVHRVAGLLFNFDESKISREGALLRGCEWVPVTVFGTFTTSGVIVSSGQEKKELGILPTIPGIDAQILGPYLKSNNDDIYSPGWELRVASARMENMLSGSNSEATIWEQLFGLRGYSAVRALQLAALVNSQSPGTYTYIMGEEFDSVGSSHIQAKIAAGSSLMAGWSFIEETYGKPGSFFWSTNKDVTDTYSGAKVLAYIVDAGAYNVEGGAMFDILDPGTAYLREQKEVLVNANRQFGLVKNIFGSNESHDDAGSAVTTEASDVEARGGGGGNKDQPTIKVDQGNTLSVGPGTGCSSANPVDYATGLMWHNFTDINLQGRSPSTGLFFQRTYYTLPQYQQSGNWVALGDLGKGWIHNFDTRLLDGAKSTSGTTSGDLTMGALSSGTNNILWVNELGNTTLFEKVGVDTYTPPPGFVGSLTIVGNTYELTVKGNKKYIFKRDLSSNHNGRLLKIRDPHGEELTLSYDGNGRLQTVTSPFAGQLSFTRDGNNQLSKVSSLKHNLTVSFTFTSGKLSSSTDIEGNSTSYQYNTGQVGKVANGLLTKITDPIGRNIEFEYYQNGKVFRETGLGRAQQVYQYAPYLFQKFTRVMGPSGHTTEYRFNDKFQAVLDVNPDNSRSYRQWTADGRVQWEKDGLGYQTDFAYDARGNQTGVKKPLHLAFVETKYDSVFDKLISFKPIVGGKSEFNLDSSTGDVLSVSRDNFGTKVYSRFTYDSFGTRLSTNNSMSTFANEADEHGFVKYQFHSRNASNLKYDSKGRVIEVRFENSRVQNYAYDSFDRLISIADTHGPSYRNYYDKVGRKIKTERISGSTIQSARFLYDDRDRLISETNFAGEKTDYRYDVVGVGCLIQDLPTQVTAPNGKVTRFEYDSMGRKTKEVFPDGTFILNTYNQRGDLISVLDALGNLIQYEYDGNRRLIKMLSQSAGWQSNMSSGSKIGYMPELVTFEYDQADRLIKKEQFLSNLAQVNGRYITSYAYDQFDRLIKKSVSHSHPTSENDISDEIMYKYYPLLDPTLISEVANKYVKLKFVYETQPPYSLVAFSQEPTSLGATLGIKKYQNRISPSQNGPIGQLTREGQKLISQTYDSAGRLLTVHGFFNGLNNSATYVYDGFGRKIHLTHSQGGYSGTFAYDNADRVTSIDWNGYPEISIDLSYDASGLVKKIVREMGVFNYDYSKRNELSSITYLGSDNFYNAWMTTTLSYDPAGNILNYYGANFQNFNNFVTNLGSSSFRPSSDGLGRLQNRFSGTDTHDFQYYPEGQLRKFRVLDSSGAVTKTVDYYYDGLGRRIAKINKVQYSAPSSVVYNYLGSENRILTASSVSGATQIEGLYVDGSGIDEHLFEITSNRGFKPYKTDHLGSVLNSQAAGGRSVYGAFGETIGPAFVGDVFDIPVAYGFTGREYDIETGLYNYRARYYDPKTARFLTKDPIGPDQGGDANPYRYAGNNPLNFVDPTGKLFCGYVNAGEQYGQEALELFSSSYVAAEKRGDTMGMITNAVGAGFAALWTPSTSDQTALVLGPTAAGAALKGAGYSVWARAYPNAGGGGVGIDKAGQQLGRLDWHKFKLNGEIVNRPHIDIPGVVKHWPWK